MRRTINFALAACLAALLAGCGNTVPKESGEVVASAPTEENVSGTAPEEGTEVPASSEAATVGGKEVATEAETSPATEPTSPPDKEISPAEAWLAKMTLREKVCQMFVVTPEQLTGYGCVTYADEAMRSGLSSYPVGGLIFFAQNLSWREQTESLLADCQKYSAEVGGVGLFTAVDEEGGSVARAAQKLGTATVNNMSYYGGLNDKETAYNVGSSIGADLAALGFNLDFAPVADVDINPANELGSRIFSSDPQVVSDMSACVVRGLQDAGVSATLKHFPGLGAEGGNTHTDTKVYIYRTLDELRETEFKAFSGGIEAGVDFVMVGHQIASGVGDDLPSDLSYRVVTELLRGELGFDGIVVTDAQRMNTISGVYGAGAAAVMSVEAGADIILTPADLSSAVGAVCEAVESGRISEDRINESAMRILTKKQEAGLLDLPR